ncbi:MAG: DUF4249 family protein, partial [Bacteroidales bacterium]|nr:DUF4249 family protein [Bacteroidales bacterium]
MQNRKLNIFLLISIFLFQACIDKFEPELDGYDQLLVIDGGVFDNPAQITIKLSYSSDVYKPTFSPAAGASVIITDNEG